MFIQEHRKGLIYLTLYVVVVAIVLAVCKSRDKYAGEGFLRIDTVHHFERLATPSCEDLASTSLALYIEGMDTGLRSVGCLDPKARVSSAAFDFKHVRPNSLTEAEDQAVWSVILSRPLQTLEQPRKLRYEIRRSDGKDGNIAPANETVSLVIFEWWASGAVAIVLGVWGPSGISCVRHSMSTRSMNATQEEDRNPIGQGGAAAILSRCA